MYKQCKVSELRPGEHFKYSSAGHLYIKISTCTSPHSSTLNAIHDMTKRNGLILAVNLDNDYHLCSVDDLLIYRATPEGKLIQKELIPFTMDTFNRSLLHQKIKPIDGNCNQSVTIKAVCETGVYVSERVMFHISFSGLLEAWKTVDTSDKLGVYV